MPRFTGCLASAFAIGVALSVTCGTAAASSVDYGDISHKNLKDLGSASTGTKLPLEIGMIADQSGIASAVKSASNPTSSSYGRYLSVSSLASKYGASSTRRNAVTGAFHKYNVKATVDAFHLRVVTTIPIGTAQKMFGTHWDVYENTSTGARSALPVNTPKLPSGLSGNVDTVAGLGHVISSGSSAASEVPSAKLTPMLQPAVYGGGTPTRTGTISPGCATNSFPSSVTAAAGLFPNQIGTAYGISTLQTAGLRGQGINVAILGEAPTPTNDVTTFRNCFGFDGTALKIHDAGSIKPILESSLDAMTVAMVAPKLNRLDLWVKQLGQDNPQGAIELLADPIQATTNGTPLPNVISVSYGVCEATAKPYSAARTLFDREAAAIAAVGITIVVAAGDSGSSACAHGVKQSQLTSYDKQKSASWPAVSPWVLAVGGTNLSLTTSNTIASSGAWNDTDYPAPYQTIAAGGG
jgi:subtilase family serine protease